VSTTIDSTVEPASGDAPLGRINHWILATIVSTTLVALSCFLALATDLHWPQSFNELGDYVAGLGAFATLIYLILGFELQRKEQLRLRQQQSLIIKDLEDQRDARARDKAQMRVAQYEKQLAASARMFEDLNHTVCKVLGRKTPGTTPHLRSFATMAHTISTAESTGRHSRDDIDTISGLLAPNAERYARLFKKLQYEAAQSSIVAEEAEFILDNSQYSAAYEELAEGAGYGGAAIRVCGRGSQ
jgi:hypothetical protein